MKAVQFDNLGNPSEVLKVVETEIPEPKKGQVRIKTTKANINPSDLLFIRGFYGQQPKFPSAAGFEGTGIIEAVGEGVNLPIGTRVVVGGMGTWSEQFLAPVNTVIPIPESVSDEVACQSFINPLSSYGMLLESGLMAGDWLLITAGASAFGKLVINLCRKRGINVIATVRREEQVQPLLDLGAAVVVNTEVEIVEKKVRKATNGVGVDCIFEAVGGRLGGQVLRTLRSGGQAFIYGTMSLQDIPLPSGLFIFNDITIRGFWLNTWLEKQTREELRKAARELLEILASDNAPVDIEARYSLDDIKEAVKHAGRTGRNGKIILSIND